MKKLLILSLLGTLISCIETSRKPPDFSDYNVIVIKVESTPDGKSYQYTYKDTGDYWYTLYGPKGQFQVGDTLVLQKKQTQCH